MANDWFYRGKKAASHALGLFLRGFIAVYRYAISPYLGPRCRFSPSCSVYAATAVRLHGPFKGTALALKRIFRCHPWGGWGYDPVPPSGLPCDPSADQDSARGKGGL